MASSARRVVHELGEAAAAVRSAVKARRFGFALRLLSCVIVNVGQLTIGSLIRRRQCPCCGWQGVGFLWSANETRTATDAVCPSCASRSRHRAERLLVPLVVEAASTETVLHFAPEAQLLPSLRSYLPDARYQTADLYRDDVDLPGQDIQRLDLAGDSFDLVICNHVLEHVLDDGAAVAEVARVTTPRGVAIITIPGVWDRVDTVHFDEVDDNGHWRDYGTCARALFTEVFADVTTFASTDLSPTPARFGIRASEPIFVCRKR